MINSELLSRLILSIKHNKSYQLLLPLQTKEISIVQVLCLFDMLDIKSTIDHIDNYAGAGKQINLILMSNKCVTLN